MTVLQNWIKYRNPQNNFRYKFPDVEKFLLEKYSMVDNQ